MIPVEASDEMVQLLRSQGRGQQVLYTKYAQSPPPPMAQYRHLLGHASYEQAYRDPALYEWLLSQRCATCSVAVSHFRTDMS